MIIKAQGRLLQVDYRSGNTGMYGSYSPSATGEMALVIPPEHAAKLGLGSYDVYIDVPERDTGMVELLEKTRLRAAKAESELAELKTALKAIAK